MTKKEIKKGLKSAEKQNGQKKTRVSKRSIDGKSTAAVLNNEVEAIACKQMEGEKKQKHREEEEIKKRREEEEETRQATEDEEKRKQVEEFKRQIKWLQE
jgi:hypothetical protein